MNEPNLEGLPYLYICRLKDMRDQINIQLDICKDESYKAQFRMIEMELRQFTKHFDNVFHGDVLKEASK